MEMQYERDVVGLVQGLLFLSMCSENDIQTKYRRPQYSTQAISKAHEAGYHLADSYKDGLGQTEQRARRRLWWACYVQDRTSNLLTGQRTIVWDEEISIAPLSLEDFDFYHTTMPDTRTNSAVPGDTLSQIFLIYLFKWKVELCRYISPTSSADLCPCEQIGNRMDTWYEQFLESVSSQSLGLNAFRCLCVHWESLVLLYRTVLLLIARKRWILEFRAFRNDGHRPNGSAYTFSPPYPEVYLQQCLDNVVRLSSQLHQRGQLRLLNHGGLWALLPVIVTIVQILIGKCKDREAEPYIETYLRSMAVLESQCDTFEAAANILPYAKHMVPRLPTPSQNTGISFSNHYPSSPQEGTHSQEPASIISWDDCILDWGRTYSVSQSSLSPATVLNVSVQLQPGIMEDMES